MQASGVKCRKCAHYYITWDRKFPYGCRAMGFKSARTPSLDVLSASGAACRRFEQKRHKDDPGRRSGGEEGQV